MCVWSTSRRRSPRRARLQCMTCGDGFRKSGLLVAAEALEPVESASTVRMRNGKISITDGPFARRRAAGRLPARSSRLNDAIRWRRRFRGARGQHRGAARAGVEPTITDLKFALVAGPGQGWRSRSSSPPLASARMRRFSAWSAECCCGAVNKDDRLIYIRQSARGIGSRTPGSRAGAATSAPASKRCRPSATSRRSFALVGLAAARGAPVSWADRSRRHGSRPVLGAS
jgi:hypothetical protein